MLTKGNLYMILDPTQLSDLCSEWLTIVSDVWNLEAFATIALVGLELNPELARARCEGNRSLIGLTCLIGSDGGRVGWRKRTNMSE